MSRRLLLLLTGLLAAAALFFVDRARYVKVYITRLPSGHLFLSEDLSHRGLAILRERERLDSIRDKDPRPIKKLEQLALWSSIQFPCSSPYPRYPPWNANVILTLCQRRVTGAFCAQYAILFGQAAQSYGYVVRYVDLAEEDRLTSHFIASVYMPDLHQWVAFEPTMGFYYMDARGNPLSVLDVHHRWKTHHWNDILNSRSGKPVDPAHLALFARFRFYLRNNFLTLPVRAIRIPRPNGFEYKFEPYRLTWTGDETDLGDPRFQSRDPRDMETGWDMSSTQDVTIQSRRSFQNFYGRMEDGVVYKVRIPLSLLESLLDSWINDERYVPLDR